VDTPVRRPQLGDAPPLSQSSSRRRPSSRIGMHRRCHAGRQSVAKRPAAFLPGLLETKPPMRAANRDYLGALLPSQKRSPSVPLPRIGPIVLRIAGPWVAGQSRQEKQIFSQIARGDVRTDFGVDFRRACTHRATPQSDLTPSHQTHRKQVSALLPNWLMTPGRRIFALT